MADGVTFKSLPTENGWKVTRDDRLITRYPTRAMAEAAASRLGLAEARKGRPAIAILYDGDGAVDK